jgi:hypothetical protein
MTTMNDNLMIGTAVLTRDGETLGEVKEVHNGAFKVAAAMQPDYWLNSTCITAIEANRAIVSFAKDDLGDYKVDDPTNH